ncbi:hypothetical protein LCL97_00190 [Seohaeicola saemankumensis]|nr:hypothetical protein [Seohaeicola saemankumensis]MCA0869231.1 hypothetical protein [Seohaeicola saemankumensis]
MADETLTTLAELELPFGRRAIVREVSYDSGLRLVRLVLREGKRITQVDLDAGAARDLAQWLQTAADRTGAAE